MSLSTKALVVTNVNSGFSLEVVKLDALKLDEALVEIHASGIYHIDLSCASGILPARLPDVLGHEGVGVVLEVGTDITKVVLGDKVLLSYSYCENCDQCTSGHALYCENLLALNFGGRRQDSSSALFKSNGSLLHSHFFGQSSFSRHAVVSRTSLVKVDQNVPLELFALLGCGLQTGAGAILNTLNVPEGATLAIFGVGSVGLSAVMAAAIRKAKEIIAVDVQPARLALAKELGATTVVNSLETDVVEYIKKICPPMGVQYALDCSGITSVVETMVDCLGARGRACSVGAPAPGRRASLDVFNHLVLGREYVGCHQGESRAREMAPYLIAQHSKGCYPLERLIQTYPFEDYQQAIEDIKSGNVVKAVLK